jgi:hypothetical protein
LETSIAEMKGRRFWFIGAAVWPSMAGGSPTPVRRCWILHCAPLGHLTGWGAEEGLSIDEHPAIRPAQAESGEMVRVHLRAFQVLSCTGRTAFHRSIIERC